METAIWFGLAAAYLVAAWLSDPYFQRIIDNRPKVYKTEDWD